MECHTVAKWIRQPDFSVAKFFTVKELYKASPLGVVTAIMTGLAHGTLWGIGSIYGLKNGLSIEQVSIFMFTFVIGGAINQYLVGYLSDKYDRRTVIVIVAFLASIFAVLAVLIGSSFIALIIIFPKLFSSFLKTIFFQLTLNKQKKDIYLNRLSGISNSILGKKSWRRPKID